MSNIIRPAFVTKLDIPVETVLDGARDLESVVVLGWDRDGAFIAASSVADTNAMLRAAALFQHKLLNGDYDD
jgi:hypothetical protein